MDIFVEQLVKKKRSAKDFMIIIACIAAALILVWLILNFAFAYIGFIGVIIAAALCYGLYVLITSVNLEYEYCFTNGALDVDKIINVRKRKRMTELNAREIDIMSSAKSEEFNKYYNNAAFKKVYACADRHSDDLYFVIYNEGGEQKMLLFTPNDEIKDGFKKFNPHKVNI